MECSLINIEHLNMSAAHLKFVYMNDQKVLRANICVETAINKVVLLS